MINTINVSNTAQVRSYNIALVKNALKAIPFGTKNTISKITSLSVATCNTLLNELADSGEILEVDTESASGCVGRPAKAYRFNESHSHILCVYATTIGGHRKLTYAVVDLLGNIVESESLEKKLVDYQEIEDLISIIMQKYTQIRAIGFGVPGVVNNDKEIDSCDIEALTDCPIVSRLSERFNIDVVIDNDMNLIAYGFYQEESLEEEFSMALVSFFDNVCAGSGIIINGTIFHGSTNFAGEVSYLPFEMNCEDQIKLLSTREGVIQLVSKTLSSLIAIINPALIVLTGNPIQENMLFEMRKNCARTIPEKHLPKIRYSSDINHYYMQGLSALTLEYINNPFH